MKNATYMYVKTKEYLIFFTVVTMTRKKREKREKNSLADTRHDFAHAKKPFSPFFLVNHSIDFT